MILHCDERFVGLYTALFRSYGIEPSVISLDTALIYEGENHFTPSNGLTIFSHLPHSELVKRWQKETFPRFNSGVPLPALPWRLGDGTLRNNGDILERSVIGYFKNQISTDIPVATPLKLTSLASLRLSPLEMFQGLVTRLSLALLRHVSTKLLGKKELVSVEFFYAGKRPSDSNSNTPMGGAILQTRLRSLMKGKKSESVLLVVLNDRITTSDDRNGLVEQVILDAKSSDFTGVIAVPSLKSLQTFGNDPRQTLRYLLQVGRQLGSDGSVVSARNSFIHQCLLAGWSPSSIKAVIPNEEPSRFVGSQSQAGKMVDEYLGLPRYKEADQGVIPLPSTEKAKRRNRFFETLSDITGQQLRGYSLFRFKNGTLMGVIDRSACAYRDNS